MREFSFVSCTTILFGKPVIKLFLTIHDFVEVVKIEKPQSLIALIKLEVSLLPSFLKAKEFDPLIYFFIDCISSHFVQLLRRDIHISTQLYILRFTNFYQNIQYTIMNIAPRFLRFYFSKLAVPIIQSTKTTNILDLARLDGEGEIDSTVILNNVFHMEWLGKGIRASKHLIVADGGANRLYDTSYRDTQKLVSIVGDLDSIRDHVRQYYLTKNVEIFDDKNHNTNDFQKVFTKCIQKNLYKSICFGGFGGRMDHTLSALSNTSKLCQKHPDLDILSIGKENMIYYLRPNVKNIVKMSQSIDLKGCGIVRFGDKVKVQTSGFKWNLGERYEYSSLEWGSFISSSNQIVEKEVQIESDGELYFVIHLKTKKTA